MSISGRQRRIAAIIGLVLIGLGILIVFSRFHGIEQATGRPRGDWLLLGVPAMIICGAVMLVRGLIWGSPPFSWTTLLITGLIMLVVGGAPWVYTPLIIRDRGMEGSGMLGTIIFIAVGLPGLLLTLLGLALRAWEAVR